MAFIDDVRTSFADFSAYTQRVIAERMPNYFNEQLSNIKSGALSFKDLLNPQNVTDDSFGIVDDLINATQQQPRLVGLSGLQEEEEEEELAPQNESRYQKATRIISEFLTSSINNFGRQFSRLFRNGTNIASWLVWAAESLEAVYTVLSFPLTMVGVASIAYLFGDKIRAREVAQNARANFNNAVQYYAVFISAVTVVGVFTLTPFATIGSIAFSPLAVTAVSVAACAASIWADQLRAQLRTDARRATGETRSPGIQFEGVVASAERRVGHRRSSSTSLSQDIVQSLQAPQIQTPPPIESQEEHEQKVVKFMGSMFGTFLASATVGGLAASAVCAAAASIGAESIYRNYPQPRNN